jgi:ABC-type lipoprotein release transport system permease subunit
MAWRNVWRNRRRTLATVGAMTLALWAMILYSALVDGWIGGMKKKVLDYEMGDLQVFAQDYRKSPSLYTKIDNVDELLAQFDEAGYPAAPRLLGSGLAAAGDQSAGISLRGVDVERDRGVSKVYENVIEGEWLDPADPTGVVIGRRLARILDVKLGAELVVLSQGADGSMANELYTVRGILGSIADGVDRGGVYMTEDAFRELMVLPEGAHQIMIRRPENVPLADAAVKVRSITGDLDAKTWRELMPTLASMMDSTDVSMYAMFIIVYIAIGIVILNAMLMAVFERVREFGVLKALGVSPAGVLTLIFIESTVQTCLALGVGVLLTLPALWYLATAGIDLTSIGDMSVVGVAWDPIWRAEISPKVFVGPIVTMVVIVAIAVVYPALRAAFISPVEAMHSR